MRTGSAIAAGLNATVTGGLGAVEQLIQDRAAAKVAKNFAEADRIRQQLADQGILLKDSAQGTTWVKA